MIIMRKVVHKNRFIGISEILYIRILKIFTFYSLRNSFNIAVNSFKINICK